MKRLASLTLAAVLILAGCRSAPRAEPDSAVAVRGTPVDIDVLSNDADPNRRPLIVTAVRGATHGKLRINSDNTIRYTSLPNASGPDTFFYRVKNNRGQSSWGRVNVRIVESIGGDILASPEAFDRPDAPARAAAPIALPGEPAAAAPLPPPPVPPSTTSPPAPAEPPPALSEADAAAFIHGISVTLFTREDDKDAPEPIRLTLRRGDETLAETTVGQGEPWEPHTDRAFELMLARPIPYRDAGSLTLEVRKTPTGPGQGGSWTAQIDVLGRLSDERTVALLPKTLPFRFGAGSSNYRSWRFAAPGRTDPRR